MKKETTEKMLKIIRVDKRIQTSLSILLGLEFENKRNTDEFTEYVEHLKLEMEYNEAIKKNLNITPKENADIFNHIRFAYYNGMILYDLNSITSLTLLNEASLYKTYCDSHKTGIKNNFLSHNHGNVPYTILNSIFIYNPLSMQEFEELDYIQNMVIKDLLLTIIKLIDSSKHIDDTFLNAKYLLAYMNSDILKYLVENNFDLSGTLLLNNATLETEISGFSITKKHPNTPDIILDGIFKNLLNQLLNHMKDVSNFTNNYDMVDFLDIVYIILKALLINMSDPDKKIEEYLSIIDENNDIHSMLIYHIKDVLIKAKPLIHSNEFSKIKPTNKVRLFN